MSTSPTAVRLFNGRFDPVTLDQCVNQVFNDMAQGKRGWLCTVNVAILMMMRKSPALQHFADQATWTVSDGQPIIWTARWFGTPLPERVTGVDLVERLCERAQAEGKGVYFLGASRSVIDTLAQRMHNRFPTLRIAHDDGYFTATQAAARADAIAQSGASILMVGMGVPRQEQFIEQQWERLGVQLAIGVGGSFDVLAGLRDRAPEWMQQIGLEWFYRLVQEPGRLWKRYLVTNTGYVLLVIRGLLLKHFRTK